MLELCPAGCGLCFGWPGLLEAMVWLSRASVKPCYGKLCFGSFRVALVHLEALSSDQLMNREGRLCRGSVRLAVGYAFGWPGLLGAMASLWSGPAGLP